MPGLLSEESSNKKRKRDPKESVKRRVAPKRSQDENGNDCDQDEILEIETAVAAGTLRAVDGVDRLLNTDLKAGTPVSSQLAAAVALCRIFYRVIATDGLVKGKGSTADEKADIARLKKSLRRYETKLVALLKSDDARNQSTAFTLLMRLVKAEVSQQEARAFEAWKTGSFQSLMRALCSGDVDPEVVAEFVDTFAEEHDDVRFFTFFGIASVLDDSKNKNMHRSRALEASINLLLRMEGIPDSGNELQDWYGEAPVQPSSPLLAIKAHRKQAQQTWLSVFKGPLSTDQRKRLLDAFTEKIAPWFNRPETMMDFLIDSYDAGGAMSLLALSGVYHLIKERNLDYPHFYHKLYSLLDEDILHSKHRARFFRLLDIFLASTHLPVALVASFIKRLSRLALHAPPGAIVMVVPWVYNMIMRHRHCAFMLHRESQEQARRDELKKEGMDDPFKMEEMDPMNTDALHSSLWELESLRHHYHPNVATLAKIVGEQFTKQEYNLEDFLDHSYNSLIEAELGKPLKKAPVVEFEIPKRIVTTDEGALDALGGLLRRVVAA